MVVDIEGVAVERGTQRRRGDGQVENHLTDGSGGKVQAAGPGRGQVAALQGQGSLAG